MKKEIHESLLVKWNEETSRELRIYPEHPRGVPVNFFLLTNTYRSGGKLAQEEGKARGASSGAWFCVRCQELHLSLLGPLPLVTGVDGSFGKGLKADDLLGVCSFDPSWGRKIQTWSLFPGYDWSKDGITLLIFPSPLVI